MNTRELREVLPALERRVDLYPYRKDNYCLQLLRYGHGPSAAIAELRNGAFGRLMDKPAMRRLAGRCGNGRMDLAQQAMDDGTEYVFRLSYGLYRGEGPWCQVSRPGYQLVVQLNFPQAHDVAYREKVKPRHHGPFAFDGHPVNRSGLNTLAWARIDLDPFCGEALVEEVQTDWLREAGDLRKTARTCKGRKGLRWEQARQWLDFGTDLDAVIDYITSDLAPFHGLWQEALLSACLWLLIERLGYRRVYMHSWETGKVLKRCSPPRSLYSQLPRKFAMRPVAYGPGLVLAQRQARRALRTLAKPFWYALSFRAAGGVH
ncbi:MAG: hypothetical protein AAGH19_06755 [Pseudomonadota bacterium]